MRVFCRRNENMFNLTSNIKKCFLFSYLVLSILGLSFNAQAEEAPVDGRTRAARFDELKPDVNFNLVKDLKKSYIPNSVVIKLSENGIKKIENRLPQLLTEMKLLEGEFEPKSFTLEELDLKKIKETVPDQYKRYFTLGINLLKRFLKIAIDKINVELDLGKLGYSLKISKINLESLPSGDPNAALLHIKLVISDLEVKLDPLDINLKFTNGLNSSDNLGNTIMVNSSQIKAGLNVPLELDLVVQLKVEDGKMKLSINEMTENFKQVDLTMNLGNVFLPTDPMIPRRNPKYISLIEDEKLRQKVMDDIEENNLTPIVEELIRIRLDEIKNILHESIANKTFQEDLNNISSDYANTFAEMGMYIPEVFASTRGDLGPKIIAGMKMGSFGYSNPNSFNVSLNGFVESELKHFDSEMIQLISPSEKNKEVEEMNRLSQSNLSLLVGSDFVTRYMQINFEHGVFNDMNFTNFGVQVTLLDLPVITYLTEKDLKEEEIEPDPDSVYIKSSSKVNVHFGNNFFNLNLIKSFLPSLQANMSGEAILKLKYIGKNSFSIFLQKIKKGKLLSVGEHNELKESAPENQEEDGFFARNFKRFTSLLSLDSFQENEIVKGLRENVFDKVNNAIKNNSVSINAIELLGLDTENRDHLQLLPEKLLGLPVLIKKVEAQGPNHLRLDINFEEMNKTTQVEAVK